MEDKKTKWSKAFAIVLMLLICLVVMATMSRSEEKAKSTKKEQQKITAQAKADAGSKKAEQAKAEEAEPQVQEPVYSIPALRTERGTNGAYSLACTNVVCMVILTQTGDVMATYSYDKLGRPHLLWQR